MTPLYGTRSEVGHVVAEAHDSRLVTTGSCPERASDFFARGRAQLRIHVRVPFRFPEPTTALSCKLR